MFTIEKIKIKVKTNKLMKEFNKKVDVNSYKKIAIGKKLEALPDLKLSK